MGQVTIYFKVIINKFTKLVGDNMFKRYNRIWIPVKELMVTCPICNNLSVKALVLRYEYYEIFTDEERGICRKYLKNLGSIINYRKRIKNDYKLQKGKR